MRGRSPETAVAGPVCQQRRAHKRRDEALDRSLLGPRGEREEDETMQGLASQAYVMDAL